MVDYGVDCGDGEMQHTAEPRDRFHVYNGLTQSMFHLQSMHSSEARHGHVERSAARRPLAHMMAIYPGLHEETDAK